MISIARTMAKVFLLVLPAALVSACAQVITVNPDGTFSPDWVDVNDGDFVYWILSEPSDSIIPVSWRAPFPDICRAYKPYDATDPNEFTGPLIQAPAGVFVLGPNEQGVQIVNESDPGVPPCSRSDSQFASGSQYLCPSAVKNETMPWTWRNPSITGVFIRLEWDDVHLGPDSYDWTALDREIERAVQNGKLYSLAFKAGNEGTPGWIFDPTVAGNDVVQQVQLQDTGSHRLPGRCGVPMTLGSPADPNYRKHYFALLRAAASHIREKNE